MSAARIRVPKALRPTDGIKLPKVTKKAAIAVAKEGRRDFLKAGVGAVVGVIAHEIIAPDDLPGDAAAQVARAKAEAARAKAAEAEEKADNAELRQKISKARKALKGEPT